MKKIILCLWGLFSLCGLNLPAQEHKWEVNLSGVYGKLSNPIGNYPPYDESASKGLGHAILPSLRYHFSPTWSTGIALLLPWAEESNAHAVCYTTGLEVSFRYSLEVLPKLRVHLSALGMLGLTGPYTSISDSYELSAIRAEEVKVYLQKTRWQIGVRPSLSYELAPRFRLELAYGFLGYRSNKYLEVNYTANVYCFPAEVKRKGAFGFNGEMGWGNSLRLGISYLL